MDEWISVKEAAMILGVSASTVLRSLNSVSAANDWWGAGNWRRKPLTERRDIQVRRARVLELAHEAIWAFERAEE